MIVLDSSAALDLLLGSVHAEWVEARLDDAGWDLHATYAIDFEVFAVVRARVLERSLRPQQGRAVLDLLANLPLRRYPAVPLLERMWSLRAHVSARDAGFVALAEALSVPLVTTDLRLSRAHGFRTAVLAP